MVSAAGRLESISEYSLKVEKDQTTHNEIGLYVPWNKIPDPRGAI